MQVIAVRCPRCLLTVYTTIMNDAPGASSSPTIFTVAPLADEDLLFYNCPMTVCEYHVTSSSPINLYRSSAPGRPMCITPGFTVVPRTSDTRPMRTADEVAALAIDVDIPATITAATEGVYTTTTTTPTATKGEGEGKPARPLVTTWRANAVPRPMTERPTPEKPAAKRLATERPAAYQATTTARFAVTPRTPHRSTNGHQARRSGAAVPPVSDIPRPTLAQPTTEKKPIPEQPSTPATEKPTIKKPAIEQPKIETPARERASPQGSGHDAKQNGIGSPAAAETQQTAGRIKGTWTDAEVGRLKELNGQRLRQAAIATEMNRTLLSVKYKLGEVRKTDRQAKAVQGTEPNNAET